MKQLIFILLLLPLFLNAQYNHEFSLALRGNITEGQFALHYENTIHWMGFHSNVAVNTKAELIWEAKLFLQHRTKYWRLYISPTPFNYSSKWIPDSETKIYHRYQRVPTDVMVERMLLPNFNIGIFYRIFNYPLVQLRYIFK